MMEIRLKSTYLEPLFVCLCLLTVLGPANGATVVTVREGSEAVLPCFIRPERDITRDVFEWKKDGQKNVFFYDAGLHYNNSLTGQDEQFKGRVSHFPEQLQSGDASIVIRDTKPSDSGNYTCDYSPDDFDRQIFTIELVVSAVVTVEEGSEAVLPCFIRPERNIKGEYFDWRKDRQKDDKLDVFEFRNGKHDPSRQDEQFKGRVSHFPEQLQSGDASIVIRDTKLSDSGNYTCDFPRLQPKAQTFYIDLVVVCILKDRSKENIPGACRKPCVTLLDQPRDEAQLQCEVRRVSPKPEVKWQDSDGNILLAKEPKITESEGSYNFILQTTVNKTDDYHCVVTQEEICHQISEKISVFIRGPELITGPEPTTGSWTGWAVGGVLGVILGVGAVLCKFNKWKKRKFHRRRQRDTELH